MNTEQELAKCKQDAVYFCEKYCRLIKPDGTHSSIVLRKHQKRQLRLMTKQ